MYRWCKERRICSVQCTASQNLENITIFLDGTGKLKHKVDVEGERRNTLNGLKRHTEEEPNAVASQVLQKTLHDIHDKEQKAIY